jgi:hypothetical protein
MYNTILVQNIKICVMTLSQQIIINTDTEMTDYHYKLKETEKERELLYFIFSFL